MLGRVCTFTIVQWFDFEEITQRLKRERCCSFSKLTGIIFANINNLISLVNRIHNSWSIFQRKMCNLFLFRNCRRVTEKVLCPKVCNHTRINTISYRQIVMVFSSQTSSAVWFDGQNSFIVSDPTTLPWCGWNERVS